MSAFVVDPKLICNIVKSIEIAVRQEGKYPATYPDIRYIEGAESLCEAVIESPEELGRTLYAMNINAVEQRYPDGNLPGTYDENDKLVQFEYKIRFDACPAPVKVYKALSCYLYQCSEGDVDTLPLFKAVSAYKSALAEHIVESLPTYEAESWG